MQAEDPIDNDKPPLFKSWRSLYAVVIAALLLQIILFYALTIYFR